MSPVLLAVVGAVLGALGAGAANLWFAKRSERRAALAAAHRLEDELTAAADRIDSNLEVGEWWAPELAPSLAAWDAYGSVLVDQLHPDVVKKLPSVVRQLRVMNAVAAAHHGQLADIQQESRYRVEAEERAREERSHVSPYLTSVPDEGVRELNRKAEDAAVAIDRDKFGDRLAALVVDLKDVASVLREAVERMRARERPVLERVRKRPMKPLLALYVVLGAVFAASWLLAPREQLSSDTVATALAVKLSHEQSVRCESVVGRAGDAWTCQAHYAAPSSRCRARPSSAAAVQRELNFVAALDERAFAQQRAADKCPWRGGNERWMAAARNSPRGTDALLIEFDKIAASAGRLESGDPKQTDDNVHGGQVNTPVDDSDDHLETTTPKPVKKPWWKLGFG